MLVGSSAFFALMAFAAKLAAVRLPGSEVAMIRFAIGSVPFFVIPPLWRKAFTFHRLDLLLYRGIFGGIAVLLYFTAISHIPVGIATLLNYTSPIFSGMFAAIFAGEPIRPRTVIPLAVAFGGVFLVIRASSGGGEFALGGWEMLGLCSAILSGAAVTAIRMARRTESSIAVFASFSIFGLLATAPFAIASWKTPNSHEWVALLTVGIASIVAQLLMTSAYRWIETLSAGVVSQLTVVLSMILGAVWLNEHLSTQALVGSAFTIAGVVAVMIVSAAPKPSAFDEAAEQ